MKGLGTKMKPLHGPFIPDPKWEMAGMTPDGRQLYHEVSPRSRGVPMLTEEGEAALEALQRKYPDVDFHVDDPALQPGPGAKSVDQISKKSDLGKAYADIVRRYRLWRKHPVNGEPLIPLNKPKFFDLDWTFYVVSQGNGNQERVKYRPPTAEEIREAERAGSIQQVQSELAAGLVERGMSAKEFLEILLDQGPVLPVPAEDVTTARETAIPEPDGPDLDEQMELPAEDVEVEYPLILDASVEPKLWLLSNGDTVTGEKTDAVAAENQVQERRTEMEAIPEH